jgi:hypothetical protein
MNEADATVPKASIVDLAISLVVLALTAIVGATFAMVSVMSVMMSDSCGTGADGGALICSDQGGNLWAAAEIFLAAGFLVVLVVGLVFTIRRYTKAKAAWPVALASVGGVVAVAVLWFGFMLALSS